MVKYNDGLTDELRKSARLLANAAKPWVTDSQHVFSVELPLSPAYRLAQLKRELSLGIT